MKYMSGKRQTVTPILKRLVKSLKGLTSPSPFSPSYCQNWGLQNSGNCSSLSKLKQPTAALKVLEVLLFKQLYPLQKIKHFMNFHESEHESNFHMKHINSDTACHDLLQAPKVPLKDKRSLGTEPDCQRRVFRARGRALTATILRNVNSKRRKSFSASAFAIALP